MKYDRQKFVDALEKQVEKNIFYHSLALEACMGGIYDYLKSKNELGENEPLKEDWLLAGLIHDIDYGGEFKNYHPLKTTEALAKYNLEIPDNVLHIIKAHAPKLTDTKLETKADWTIFCADSLTGLIVATALIYPDKKLESVKASSVLKRFLKQPKFAAGTRREDVAMCEKSEGLNIPLEKFIEICLTSMQSVAPTIGL
ncbi:hypothetical protein A3F08_00765 [Candidatus Berkelbacteria bacterium RIFCSPHIGHO2_12_FULL_36_9]|uniref:HD domain-containing protein n=1 Tax=Candidatus Berkelbacteria bacterium RIFCSPHIGHO2_12_FULL_36_9 TaxID=1797469 RepID=A0A1F5EJF7_9BACT|nr:MAG: hypothetical protein A3F08_00765 [Candidatus Berkelbacteria bacterium RIFCSPHIGHO2_12_FULL_36_9]